MDLLQNFRNKQIIRSQISCPKELNIWLDHCQYVIPIEFDKNSKHIYKFKKRKQEINPFFKLALETLNREQKVLYYLRLVDHLENLSKGIDTPPKVTEVKVRPIQGLCECRSFNLKIWKLKNIRLDRTRHEVMVQNEKDNKIKTYELRDYLARRSKNKSRHALVLLAINDRPHEKSREVYIAFQDSEVVKFWYTLISEEIAICEWLRIKEILQTKQGNSQNKSFTKPQETLMNSSITSIDSLSKKSDNGSEMSQIHQDELLEEQEKLQKEEEDILGKTFIDQLVDDQCPNFEDFVDAIDNENQKVVESKKNLDFFHKLLPDYELDDIMELADYETVFIEEGKIQLLKNLTNLCRFKLIVTFPLKLYEPKQLFCLISEPKFATKINNNVEEQTIKTLLKSENSAIVYQTLKAYNKFYRLRDFIFVRHAFTHNNNFYMVDKSLDNINFPPFMTLVRGEISAVWGVIREEKSQELKLVGDFVIVNSGILNEQQEANLSLKYLAGFKELLKQEPESGIESSMFDIDWNIDKKEVNKKFEEIRVRRKTIQVEKEKLKGKFESNEQNTDKINFTKKTSSVYDVQSSSPQRINQEGQKHLNQISFHSNIGVSNRILDKIPAEKQKLEKVIQEKKVPEKDIQINKIQSEEPLEKKVKLLHTQLQIVRKFDHNGYVMMDKGYIKKMFITKPVEKEPYNQYSVVKGHAIWKGDWIHDEKNGGIIFINQKKIEDQKGVLKFILTKIGKNILSGKSVLNISLPVDIFSTESNIQRLLLSMSYGPKLLENLNQRPLLEKLAQVVAFGVSNSVLYLTIQKPFNPILGETFQCWINGCPGYGEQISHHPPITALMFMGRGYRVTCQLESKVELHMNSGCGTNEGVYKVLFDDGTQICFMTPGGEISGLTFGQRRFNLVGKCKFIFYQAYYWIQKQRIFLELNFEAGKKSFFSKQDKPCDLFQGKVFEVTSEFLKTFPKSKKKQPTDKDKLKVLGSYEGIWNKYIKFNNQEIFSFDKVIPLKIEYEKQPLPSDSNWREDIEYRRINKITRAQTQKQRLEVLQRTDRKFRQKYAKK